MSRQVQHPRLLPPTRPSTTHEMDCVLPNGMGSRPVHCNFLCAIIRLHAAIAVLGSCGPGSAPREVPEAGHTASVLQHQRHHEVSIATKISTSCRLIDSCVLQHRSRLRHLHPTNAHRLEAADAARSKDGFVRSSRCRTGRSCSWLCALLLRAVPLR